MPQLSLKRNMNKTESDDDVIEILPKKLRLEKKSPNDKIIIQNLMVVNQSLKHENKKLVGLNNKLSKLVRKCDYGKRQKLSFKLSTDLIKIDSLINLMNASRYSNTETFKHLEARYKYNSKIIQSHPSPSNVLMRLCKKNVTNVFDAFNKYCNSREKQIFFISSMLNECYFCDETRQTSYSTVYKFYDHLVLKHEIFLKINIISFN
jgi:hypothetical protein